MFSSLRSRCTTPFYKRAEIHMRFCTTVSSCLQSDVSPLCMQTYEFRVWSWQYNPSVRCAERLSFIFNFISHYIPLGASCCRAMCLMYQRVLRKVLRLFNHHQAWGSALFGLINLMALSTCRPTWSHRAQTAVDAGCWAVELFGPILEKKACCRIKCFIDGEWVVNHKNRQCCYR